MNAGLAFASAGAAIAAARPSADPQIGGAGRILIYKTNATVQASAALTKGADTVFNVKGKAWGASDNVFAVDKPKSL